MSFDPKLNLYTPASSAIFYNKIKQLNQKSPIVPSQEYEIELSGGTYVFKGDNLIDLQSTFQKLDQADGTEDGYFSTYYKALDINPNEHLIEKKWGRNILSVSYEAFFPIAGNEKEFTETEDAIYKLVSSNKLYWGRNLKDVIQTSNDFDPNDLHSLAELALTYGFNHSVLKMFQKSAEPFKNVFCLDSSYMGGTGIMNLTDMNHPSEGTIVLSLEAHLAGVYDAQTSDDAIRNIGAWVNHERGHILMLSVGSIVQRPFAPYMNFNQIMAGTEKNNLFIELLNYFQRHSTKQIDLAYQFAYMTQEVCDPITAWYYSEVSFQTRALELAKAIDWWIKDIDQHNIDDYTMMRIAYIMQMARFCGVANNKIEVLKTKVFTKLNSSQQQTFEKLSEWFAFVQKKFSDNFIAFNQHFNNIVKPYDPNTISQ